MSKRKGYDYDSIGEDKAREVSFAPSFKSDYNKVANVTSIQSLFPAHLKYVGAVSGKVYEWERAGNIVSVDNDDVPALLAKRVGAKGCCGGNRGGNKVLAVIN